MKADLTRDTFHPLKHYSRVLAQQGRVQLDADMNEQAAILLRYVQTLAADLIGPAGGPLNSNLGITPGFAVIPLAPGVTPADFQIGFGNYYVDGLPCHADFVPITFFQTATATVLQVINWRSEFELQPVPYFYEIYDANPSTQPPPAPLSVQITSSNKAQNQITLQIAPDLSAFNNPEMRRLITYLHQPDYVFSITPSTVSPPPLPLPSSTNLQIYLDVWERAITYAEDDSIREVALGGPDTSARTKLVWQVKWQPAVTGPDGQELCSTPAPLGPRGWLQAKAKQNSQSTNPCIIDPNASYSGPENQLYRVEINRSGNAGTISGQSATFKWSRENGSVLFPIASGGGTATVVVESLGRDDRFGLAEGNLVEVQDDRSVLLNQPGNLQPVQGIDRPSMTVTLGGTPDSHIEGDETLHPLLRRWDQTAGDPVEQGLTLDTDNCAFVQEGMWLALEDGVQIQFQPSSLVPPLAGTKAQPNFYLTSDYWLIPARTATGDVEWPKVLDPQGNPEVDVNGNIIPVALSPHGVDHYYAPLAIISVDGKGTVTRVSECRSSFSTGSSPLSLQKKL